MIQKRRNCPWCGHQPVTMLIEGFWHIFCHNKECKLRPASVPQFTSRKDAEDAWNIPTKKSEHYYSESDLKKIFYDVMIDPIIWEKFFPGTELWSSE